MEVWRHVAGLVVWRYGGVEVAHGGLQGFSLITRVSKMGP
jgi:hypothetical protein